ncbi:MAG TPA: methyl-accepting chemotaxis protein [Prolixibacteraceae bacterium]|nr:methyl-accepting chemotaxis protein [Prolixibacteraceae bacterium]HPS12823.1 methyl-accepting chemotaxis protein [Prolixibacteraceae bacterium]
MEKYFIILAILIFSIVAFLIERHHSRKKILAESDQLLQLKSQYSLLENQYVQLTKKYNESEILSRIVRQSPNAIMLMDDDGNIQWINRGFDEMYEYNYEEFTRVLGKNYRQTSFSPDVESRLALIRESRQPFRYEALNITRTGKELWTQTALVPIFNDQGRLSNMVTIDTDIHQRVTQSDKLVAEMEQMNLRIDNLTSQFKHLEVDVLGLFGRINELYELVEQTDQILQFIKNISDETRILGFNASIEAGRAGEHGLGFRVITNNIVDISQNTIRSVKEISDILFSIKQKQNELIVQKEGSEFQMKDFHRLVSLIKKEVEEIKSSIIEFKSLA